MVADNTKILTAEQEQQLRAPIDEYVGGIQKKIDALRADGTDKVLEYQSALEDLKRVFLEVLARKEEKVDRVRSDFGVIKRERISLSARIGSVLNYTRKHRNFSFRQMLGQAEGRMEVVVTFLALLELMKMGKVQVCQKDTFSDIEVHATKETDTEDLDLRDLEDA